jgi:hypothetical protein
MVKFNQYLIVIRLLRPCNAIVAQLLKDVGLVYDFNFLQAERYMHYGINYSYKTSFKKYLQQ